MALIGLQQAGVGDAGAEPFQTVVLVLQLVDLAGGAVDLGVALEMAVEAGDPGDHGRRALARPRALDGLARGLLHGEEVRAVHLHRRHAEAGRPAGDVLGADRVVDAGALAVTVVLDHEDAWQLQHHGHVHGLEGGALVGAAVAGEADRHPVGAARLGAQCRPDGQRRVAADDGVGAQHALVQIGDVHGPALAAAQAPGLGEDLQHHALYVAALGDAVAVAAMGRADVVVVGQMQADTGGDGLLTGVQMHEARDIAGGVLHVNAVLERADGAHGPVGAQ